MADSSGRRALGLVRFRFATGLLGVWYKALNNMAGITIAGSGRYAPGEPISNEDLSRVMDTSDDWIRPRTGIAQRHFAAEGEGASDLAEKAARTALDDSGLKPEDVDYIVFATMTPEYVFPGSGGLLGAKLGIAGVPALDIRQQCAAVPFGLQVAQGLVQSGAAQTILFVGAEAHAGFMPWDWEALEKGDVARASDEAFEFASKHRGVAVLFGDGAGAFVLREASEPNSGLLGVVTHTDGRAFDQIYIPGGSFSQRHYWKQTVDVRIPSMKGRELFKNAVTLLPKVVHELCEQTGVQLDEIDWFVAHQANDRINQAVQQALKVPAEKIPSNIERYGNTSAGTIPILTDEMLRDGRITKGQLVCFLALGAGLNWGAALMRM